MAKANRSTGNNESRLDLLDALNANITQAQSILTAVRTDAGSPEGGALAAETVRELLWAADALLDRARDSVGVLQFVGK